MMKRLTCARVREREKKVGERGVETRGGGGTTTLISYENTASNLAVLFIQTMSASNYPTQATN